VLRQVPLGRFDAVLYVRGHVDGRRRLHHFAQQTRSDHQQAAVVHAHVPLSEIPVQVAEHFSDRRAFGRDEEVVDSHARHYSS